MIFDSIFLWGLSGGFLLRTQMLKFNRESFTSRPWLFAKYMLIGGVGASYVEWIKRVSIETLCRNEELNDQREKYWKLDSLGSGLESYGEHKRNLLQLAVEEHMI